MKIAVVGATGLVGRMMIALIKQNFPSATILGYATKKSDGLIIDGVLVKELCKANIKKVDFALFSAGGETSKMWARSFAKLGAIVVDNSNAFRRYKNVPLVVPEINFDDVANKKIIANPNCSTIQVALPLFYMQKFGKIRRVICSTYQAASGAGQKGLEDLKNNTTQKFTYPLQNNLIPQIDKPLEDNYTLEEDKICFELKKILHLPDLKACATAVRVPVEHCHGVSVNIEFEKKVNINKLKTHLQSCFGIVVCDDLQNSQYPQNLLATGKDDVFVGRIRKDRSCESGLVFWCVADNLRKGAATNAVQIVKKITEMHAEKFEKHIRY